MRVAGFPRPKLICVVEFSPSMLISVISFLSLFFFSFRIFLAVLRHQASTVENRKSPTAIKAYPPIRYTTCYPMREHVFIPILAIRQLHHKA